jgi:hypothetical protein
MKLKGWSKKREMPSAWSPNEGKGDLEGFKEFIESRGQETGAWRGTVR